MKAVDKLFKYGGGAAYTETELDDICGEIESLRAQLAELTEVNSKWHDYAKNEGVRRQGEIKAAIDGLNPPAAKVPECTWRCDDDESSMWEGSCGAAWYFESGGPVENEQNYCPSCGGKCVLSAQEGEK